MSRASAPMMSPATMNPIMTTTLSLVVFPNRTHGPVDDAGLRACRALDTGPVRLTEDPRRRAAILGVGVVLVLLVGSLVLVAVRALLGDATGCSVTMRGRTV